MASDFILQLVILLFSIVAHEYAHGAMALRLGDGTAKAMGRLTLNPLKHLDLFGSFLVPLTMVMAGLSPLGWAKPVPINPLNFRDRKWGSAKVAIAGPIANISLAIFFGILLRFLPAGGSLFWQDLANVFALIVLINLFLTIFNLVPLPPLDGSHIFLSFLPDRAEKLRISFASYGIILFLAFVFFFSWILSPIVGVLFKLITGI